MIRPLIAAGGMVALLVVCAFGVDYWLGWHADQGTRHDFCSIVQLVTARPVPKPADPEANPSRETAYVFYRDFVTLGQRLGCLTRRVLPPLSPSYATVR